MNTVLCHCGSGLRLVRCCGADQAAWATAEAVALLDPQAQDATKFFNEKKYAEAEALALKLLDVAPNLRLALRVLFELRKAQNRVAAAEVLARRLATLPGTAPVRAAAWLQLAQYIIGQGRHADALDPARQAVIAAPREVTAQHVMGVALTETGQLAEGERHYRRAMALQGGSDGVMMANIAWNLKLQGRLTEAALLYQQALALRPDNRRGLGGYAQVEFARGDRAQAIELLEGGLSQWENDRTLRLLRAMAGLAAGDANFVLAGLAGAPESLLAPEWAVRGQAHARLGQLAEAVACYAAAKKHLRERGQLAYQSELFAAKAEATTAYFTADRFAPLPRAAAAPARQPVLLLGFPRSGTGLLEQLLAQVPGIAAGDECAPIAELAAQLPRLAGGEGEYPAALDNLLVGAGQDLAERLRARYEAARRQLGLARPEVLFITDRAASNAWHLGLMKLLFPEAPVIHVLRHPLDIMLSNLAQDRKLEGNCHVSMAATARHYALTMSVIKHLRGQLTLRYLPVRYEDIVAAPAVQLARILQFIGVDAALAPAPEILAANAAPLRDPVPVHMALRQPVHDRGVARYRDYERAVPNLFAEVREVLAPWIAELGYAAAGGEA